MNDLISIITFMGMLAVALYWHSRSKNRFGNKIKFKNKWYPVTAAVLFIIPCIESIDQVLASAGRPVDLVYLGLILAILATLLTKRRLFISLLNLWTILNLLSAVIATYHFVHGNRAFTNLFERLLSFAIVGLVFFGKNAFVIIDDRYPPPRAGANNGLVSDAAKDATPHTP
jgi:hypothetical protein